MTAPTERPLLDADRALELLTDVVARRGADFVYKGECVYATDALGHTVSDLCEADEELGTDAVEFVGPPKVACIAGWVLADFGFSIDELWGLQASVDHVLGWGLANPLYGTNDPRTLSPRMAAALLVEADVAPDSDQEGRVGADETAMRMLVAAQALQDHGRTWGEALEAAVIIYDTMKEKS